MNYQKLFNYMSEEHGIVLLEQDMQEICNIVNEMQSESISVCDESGSEDVKMSVSGCLYALLIQSKC